MANADKLIQESEIMFRGEMRKLRFSLRTFLIFDEITGKDSLSGEIWAQPSLATFSMLVCAALKRVIPELNATEALDELSLGDIFTMMPEIVKGFQASQSEKKKEAEPEAPSATPTP